VSDKLAESAETKTEEVKQEVAAAAAADTAEATSPTAASGN